VHEQIVSGSVFGNVLLARGDEGEVERSKNIIQAALIGLAVTVSAYAITVFINSVLTSAK
jgi:hypothetical protein